MRRRFPLGIVLVTGLLGIIPFFCPHPIVQQVDDVIRNKLLRIISDTLQMMEDINTYSDMGLLVSISGGMCPLWYVAYAQPRFGIKVACGITAVFVADFFPYLQTGQFSGMLCGMKGAAEYEELVSKKWDVGGRRKAAEGMSSQSIAHIAIMVFVILGNIGYFAVRRRKR